MKIVVDQNIRGIGQTFERHGDIVLMEGREIRKRDVIDADLLIIRTGTLARAELLAGTAVRFVGTTAIGTDHLDIPWLDSQGVRWCNAPGCNADSAAQYTVAMAWLACQRLGKHPGELKAGIIGRGNVGSRVQALLQALGMKTVANDPPLAESGVEGLVSLDEALASDLVCLHVPLTREGPYVTRGMIGTGQLEQLPEGALLVNTARGDVIEGPALLTELETGRIHAALDCWPNEPALDPRLLERTVVATPHVAGYSDDGKRNGSWMVYRDFREWAGLGDLQRPASSQDRLELVVRDSDDVLAAAFEAACFVSRHDAAMRQLASGPPERIASGFDGLRRDYPFRRDFHGWTVACSNEHDRSRLDRLGFMTRLA